MQIVATITSLFALLLAAPAPGGGDEKDGKKAPPAFEIELKPTALTRGLEVTLADLADISPLGTDALAIGAVRFGPAPQAGYSRTVSRSELLQSLVAAGHAAGNFKFKGASETLVQTIVVVVSPTSRVVSATTVLNAILEQEGGDVDVEPPARPRSLQLPPGRRSQELRARVRGGKTGVNAAVVDVDVLVDDAVAKTVPVQFKLIRWQPVLKVNVAVRQGMPLDASNVVLGREKLAQATGLFLSSLEQVTGMIARRNLQPNQMLTLADVAAPAVIRKGDIVTVVITRGHVKVTVRGMANQDAALGERITVVNLQSRALITGVAAAAGTVVVPVN